MLFLQGFDFSLLLVASLRLLSRLGFSLLIDALGSQVHVDDEWLGHFFQLLVDLDLVLLGRGTLLAMVEHHALLGSVTEDVVGELVVSQNQVELLI